MKKYIPYIYTMDCDICDAAVELHVINENEFPLGQCPMCGESNEWVSTEDL